MSHQQVIEAGGFVHCVFFWLKEPENQQAREEFEHHLKTFLGTSLYVKAKHIGTMASSKMASSERDVVDSTYTYCLITTFKNREEQDKYQQEPVHLKFIEDAKHLWGKVVVYDSDSII